MTGSRNPNFDRIASIYDFFKTILLFGAIQRCQYYHLLLLKDCKRILVIGGGTGKIIGQIHRHCEFEELVYVDSSNRMIEKAKKYVEKTRPEILDKIEFQNEDLLVGFEGGDFDAVIAPFILDCFTNEELIELVKKLKNWLKPSGLLFFSDFHESKTSTGSRVFSRLITRPIYFALDLTCNLNIKSLPDFDILFNNTSLTTLENKLRFIGVLQSRVLRLTQ